MRQSRAYLPFEQQENEEEIEETATLRELTGGPSVLRFPGRSQTRRIPSGLRRALYEGQEAVGERASAAAERTSEYMRERRASEIVEDAEDYIRHRPIQSVFSAVAIGVIIGRLLK